MRRLTLIATMALTALACGPAQAVNWVSLGSSPDGWVEVLVETSTIRVEGDVRHAWTRRVLPPDPEARAGHRAETRVTQYLTRYAVNCRDEMHRNEQTAIFFDYGTMWNWEADTTAKPWRPVAPESPESQIREFVCAWQRN